MNMTLDGFCDHTAGIADAELHQHYTDVLRSAGAILYGRITYELMKNYWPAVVKNPTGDTTTDEFALAIQDVPKVVFSRTLQHAGSAALGWENSRLAGRSLEEEVLELKQQPGKDVFACSPSIIAALTKLGLIDEYQLCIHPVIAGSGLPLFRNITEHIILKRVQTKPFSSGTMALYYEPTKK